MEMCIYIKTFVKGSVSFEQVGVNSTGHAESQDVRFSWPATTTIFH